VNRVEDRAPAISTLPHAAEWLLLLRLDLRLFARHGVLAAVAVVTAVWCALLVAVPDELARVLVAPALYLDAAIIGLMFVGGAVLIERRQGSLEALAVSPVRASSYVAAKVGALTALAVGASLTIALVAAPVLRPVQLTAGVVLLSVPVLLVALGVAARASSITAYLFALQPATVPAVVPLVLAAGWIPTWLGWLGPTTGPYRLLQAGTGGAPLAAPELVAAVVVPVATSWLLWRFVVRRVRTELLRSGRLT
jgi:fluoroquinolone transport system permease protein